MRAAQFANENAELMRALRLPKEGLDHAASRLRKEFAGGSKPGIATPSTSGLIRSTPSPTATAMAMPSVKSKPSDTVRAVESASGFPAAVKWLGLTRARSKESW